MPFSCQLRRQRETLYAPLWHGSRLYENQALSAVCETLKMFLFTMYSADKSRLQLVSVILVSS